MEEFYGSLTDGVLTVGEKMLSKSVPSHHFANEGVEFVTVGAFSLGETDPSFARDSFFVTDSHSGLRFEVRVYTGSRKVRYEVATDTGIKAIKKAML